MIAELIAHLEVEGKQKFDQIAEAIAVHDKSVSALIDLVPRLETAVNRLEELLPVPASVRADIREAENVIGEIERDIGVSGLVAAPLPESTPSRAPRNSQVADEPARAAAPEPLRVTGVPVPAADELAR